MLEVAHNGVFILDAVVDFYESTNPELPFIQWWSSMTETQKSATVLNILLHKYRGRLPQTNGGANEAR